MTCSRAVGNAGQRQIDPASLVVRQLYGVDHFLDPGTVFEASLVALAAGFDLVDEILDEIGVEQRPPGFARVAAGRIEALGDLGQVELDGIWTGEADGLGDAVL